MQEYPGTNFHDLNLDWILEEIQSLRAEWEQWQLEHSDNEEVDTDAPTVSGN